MKPYYDDGRGIVIYHGDCREILPSLSGVNLVVADPPYNGVLADDWDNQWESDTDFLEWLDAAVAGLAGTLTDNGTLYLFSSPRLAAQIEVQSSRRVRIINSAVWDKSDGRKGAAGSGIDVTALRAYWPANTERVLVAEKLVNGAYAEADDKAKEASGYWTACEAGKRSVIGEYLRAEFLRAGVTHKEMAALFPSRTGGMTGCVSNWLLGANIPTPEQYVAMRSYLNRDRGDYLRKEYDDLRKEYDDLRKAYDDLRKAYDDLRRPFFLHPSEQWGDVWRFGIERDRQHPAQKPLPLIQQIVRVSSRQNDLVLDPFLGSGTTLVAAKAEGRRAIGIEIEERYAEIAAERLSQEVLDLAPRD